MSNLDRFKFRGFIQKTGNRNPFMFYGISFKLYVDDDVVLFDENGNKSPMFKIKNLMQCTGLKDKNGNLIYEGDIIKTSFVNCETGEPEEDDGNFSQIHFRDCCFCIVQNVGTEDEYAEHLFNEWGEEWDGSCYEIIGNIYENLDLLK